jgi:DNA-binding IscR family transcriptional regulator
VFDTPALKDPDCAPELKHAWKKLQQAMEEVAESITFQELLEEHLQKEKMYYI